MAEGGGRNAAKTLCYAMEVPDQCTSMCYYSNHCRLSTDSVFAIGLTQPAGSSDNPLSNAIQCGRPTEGPSLLLKDL
jgi:hypothetical protein